MNSRQPADDMPRLSQLSFWLIFAVALLIFLFAAGPIWQNPWDIEDAVLFSYAPILPLVVCALLLEKKFSWRAFGLDGMAIVLLKFGVTVATATVLWATAGPPPAKPAAHAPGPPVRFDEDAGPRPTIIDPAQTGTLEVVLSKDSAPALVYIKEGLEAFVFETPAQAIAVHNDGTGYVPSLFAVQTQQTISVRSQNNVLHTFLARPVAQGSAQPHPLFNVPALASGLANTTRFDATGIVTLSCTVHETEEAPAFASVRAHPFSKRAEPGTAVRFTNVPVGAMTVGTFVPGRTEALTRALVVAGQTTRVDVTP